MLEAEEIIERIKEKTPLRTNKEISTVVGVLPTNFSRKVRSNEFETKWAFLIAQKYDLSTDWILTGQNHNSKPESNFFVVLEEWAKETSGNGDMTAIKNMICSCLPMFKEWKKRKEEQESETDTSADQKIA